MCLAPNLSRAAVVDLGISASSLVFSEDTLIEGKPVRVYASIRNYGDTDATAYVAFYLGADLIGRSQIVSVLADGAKDDVFVDFEPPAGSFNIRAVVQGANPADSNAANNEAMTPLFRAFADTDGDGVIDDEDNCSERDNPDQEDLDDDGKGDICDTDTDGDGVMNVDDDFPEDGSKSEKVVEEASVPAPVVKEVVAVKTEEKVTEPSPAPVATASAPEPVVEGLQDEQSAEPEPTEVAFDLSGLGLGGSTTSPAARFTYTQLDWKTYEFTAIPPLGDSNPSYAWDFGDGATSAQPTITHAFAASGVYTVTLATVDDEGQVSTDSDTVKVSFFHLGNPLLLLTLGVLVAILIGLGWFILRLRRGEEV
jgi:PKD repeat protein